MPFLPPNQQRQSTDGRFIKVLKHKTVLVILVMSQHVEGCGKIMLHLQLFSELHWIYHSAQIFSQCIACSGIGV